MAAEAIGYRSVAQGVRRPGRGVDHSPRSSAETKNEWSCTATPPACLHSVERDTFAFTEIRTTTL